MATLPIQVLQQTHREYNLDRLRDYRALYCGGHRFQERVARFLPIRPMEKNERWIERLNEAHYRCYMGSIINQFASMLVSKPLEIRSKDESGNVSAPDEFYSDLKEDCDGAGTDLMAFIRQRIVDAMVDRRAWWLMKRPNFLPNAGEDLSLADWEDRKLGDVVFSAIESEDVRDWSLDAFGNLIEVLTYSCVRADVGMRSMRKSVRHTWQIYDATTVETFECVVEEGKELPTEVVGDGGVPHGFKSIPVVCLDLGHELWVADRLASPQLEHFRLSNALGWGIRTTCYAMPVFKLMNNSEGKARPPTMGSGYFLQIDVQEDFAWYAPPTEPFDVIQREIDSQKDELYRVAQQLAQGVNNNAAAVGRSGASKLADAEATRIVLECLGQAAREAIEKSFDLSAGARGETNQFSIDGLGGSELYDVVELTQIAPDVSAADIPSPTFLREWKTRLALALVPGADAETKDTIRKEIQEGVPDELPDPKAVAAIAAAKQGKLLVDPAQESDGQPGREQPPSAFGG
jgi:hypothetical protein